jgi:hypothetical protein
MEDANAVAAVQEAGGKWHWYLLRNPFYNSTVSLRASGSLVVRELCADLASGWKVGFGYS